MYFIKCDDYEIFGNDQFFYNVVDIIKDIKIIKLLKFKIKDGPDFGKDKRYDRRVMFEFNKAQHIIMRFMLEKDQLKGLFMEYLEQV